MRAVLCTLGSLIAIGGLLAVPAVADDVIVATVLGENVTRGQLAAAGDADSRAQHVMELIRSRIFRDYVKRNALTATPAEIAELKAYDVEFEKKDRAQRARKLDELDTRLRLDRMSPGERAHVEDFRNTLRRLARHDAETDRQPPPDPAVYAAQYAPWIEMWKMHQSLYARYGGVVALTETGPYPLGAWAALVAEYEQEGRLHFSDAALRVRVYALLHAPPRLTVPPERVDFTPYWKKPIPPSYFPD